MKYTKLSKKDAKELLKKNLIPQLEKYGFNEFYSKGDATFLERKTKDGSDSIVFSFRLASKNNEIGQDMTYEITKRINKVEEILFDLSKKVDMNPPPTQDSITLGTDSYRLHGRSGYELLGPMTDEEDVKKECKKVIEFMLKVGIPLLEKYDSLTEIDKLVNSEESFWLHDIMKVISFGSEFGIKI